MPSDEVKDFLNKYYAAEHVEYDTLGKKIAATVIPESVRKKSRFSKLKENIDTLKNEGDANEELFTDDMFYVDTEEYMTNEKKQLSKRTICSLLLLVVMIPLTILFGIKFMGDRKYLFIGLVIAFYAIIPFFMVFEGRKPQARELIVLATLAAIATAGRAAFFMLPAFKPIVAVVIISGIAFGGEAGFLVGAITMLVSNFLFGQGPWTPWQMLAMGAIGFIAGILNRKGLLPAKRKDLCIFGFLATLFIYGGIMNPASMFMYMGAGSEVSWTALLAKYISGVPYDTVHATATFIFLWLGAKPMLEKLQRIKVKYGLMEQR